jgi:uncharacterized RDD family membrane protein YckC
MPSPESNDNPFAAPEAEDAAALAPDADGQSLAGRWTRLGASLLDTLFLVILNIPVLIFILGVDFTSPEIENQPFVQVLLQAGVGLAIFLILNGYTLHKRGQSLGKIIAGIRIVRIDGQPVSGMDTIVKRVLPIMAIAQVPAVGWIFSLVDSLFIFRGDRRCIHDMIAGTKVIKGQPA